MWEVTYTDEFGDWWETLSESEQKRVAYTVNLLEKAGPSLPFPYSSKVKRSKHKAMRELRTQHEGNLE